MSILYSGDITKVTSSGVTPVDEHESGARRDPCRPSSPSTSSLSVFAASREKVYRLAARGELPSYKVEGRRLFNEAEIAR